MGAAKSNVTAPNRRKAQWGPGRWLILGLVWLCFVASSGCAHFRPQPNVAPRIDLPANLSAPCLRGRLPAVDELTVGEALSQWIEAEAAAACERGRADQIIGVIATANRVWAEQNEDR